VEVLCRQRVIEAKWKQRAALITLAGFFLFEFSIKSFLGSSGDLLL
jgi:hypothetical protein